MTSRSLIRVRRSGASVLATVALICASPANAAEVTTAQLLERLEKLENELAIQKDIEDIRRLQYAYNYYNSNGMPAQVIGVIADKAESLEIGGRGVYKGKEGFIRAFQSYAKDGKIKDKPQNFGDALFQVAAMDVITVAPDRQSAQARVRVLTPIFRGYPNTRFKLNAGEYEMKYLKEGGVWKISKFKYVHTFSADFNKDGTISPGYSTAPDKTADAPTTWYHPWPETGTLPYHFVNPVTGEPSPELTGTQRYWIGNWPGEFGKTGHR
jgi:SnoaL-like domain